MLNVVILGSTGSLGIQTLEILAKHKTQFKIIGLSANKNAKLLKSQAEQFHVKNLALGAVAAKKLATLSQADIIINVLSGTAGIAPTLAALKAQKILLLGNKESIVAEGEKIMKLAAANKNPNALIPLDSEHNAIFEILKYLTEKSPKFEIARLILPCSGGPFLKTPKDKLRKITATQAIRHPRWQMGDKISVESATLINKGLEIIEAHYLFQIPLNKISVKIHPQCQIHGAVEIATSGTDTITLGYISPPDMREHIENALLRAANLKPTSLRKIRPLTNAELKTLKTPQLSLHQKLPGIKLILNYFKKHPQEMKKFLLHEEKIIEKFLTNQITFPEIFSELKKL